MLGLSERGDWATKSRSRGVDAEHFARSYPDWLDFKRYYRRLMLGIINPLR